MNFFVYFFYVYLIVVCSSLVSATTCLNGGDAEAHFQYSGLLTNELGETTSGFQTIEMRFDLYSSEDTLQGDYSQTFSAVEVKDGVFFLEVGPCLPNLTKSHYVQLAVNNEQLSSRTKLLSLPLSIESLNSQKLSGLTTQELFLKIDESISLVLLDFSTNNIAPAIGILSQGLQAHQDNVTNPHQVTKSHVGLNNVDNVKQLAQSALQVTLNPTSDSDVPTSKAVADHVSSQIANISITGFEIANPNLQNHLTRLDNPHIVTKSQLNLNLVSNVLQMPLSYLQTVLSTTSNINVPSSSAVATYVHHNITQAMSSLDLSNLEPANSNIQAHILRVDNPHTVTKAQVGLSQVDDVKQLAFSDFKTSLNTTSDTDIPSSKAVSDHVNSVVSGIDYSTLEPANVNIQAHIVRVDNPHTVTKSQVGLSNVSNIIQLPMSYLQTVLTSDSNINVPSSSAVATYVNQNIDDAMSSLDLSGFEPENVNIQGHIVRVDNPHTVTKVQLGLDQVDNVKQLAFSDFKISLNTTSDTDIPSSKAVSDHINSVVSGIDYSTLEPANANIQAHIVRVDNPHIITKSQVGLSNVSNVIQLPMSYLQTVLTSDSNINVPSSSAVATFVYENIDDAMSSLDQVDNVKQLAFSDFKTSLNTTSDTDIPSSKAVSDHINSVISGVDHSTLEPANANIQTHIANNTGNPHNITKASLGLENVPNTNIAYASTIVADQFIQSNVDNLRANKLSDGSMPWTTYEPALSGGSTDQVLRSDRQWIDLTPSVVGLPDVQNINVKNSFIQNIDQGIEATFIKANNLDGLELVNSSDEGMIIATYGHVGLGTFEPQKRLDISGQSDNVDDAAIGIRNSSTNGWSILNFKNTAANGREIKLALGGPTASINPNSLYIHDLTSDVTRFLVDSTGNIGINTTAPLTKLDINGAIRISSATTSTQEVGMIQYANNHFQGFDGSNWLNLDTLTASNTSQNNASGTSSTISGGANNFADGLFSVISGGDSNLAIGSYSSVLGGKHNTATGDNSTIVGGIGHYASGHYSFIGGGFDNETNGIYNTISGGRLNFTSGIESTVSGGYNNQVTGNGSTISGGENNILSGNYSVIPGGTDLTFHAHNSFGFNGTGGAITIGTETNAAFFMVDRFSIGEAIPNDTLEIKDNDGDAVIHLRGLNSARLVLDAKTNSDFSQISFNKNTIGQGNISFAHNDTQSLRKIRMGLGGTDKFFFTGDGKLGIGFSNLNPLFNLDVEGDIRATSTIAIQTDIGNTLIELDAGSSSDINIIDFKHNDGSKGSIRYLHNSTVADQRMDFAVNSGTHLSVLGDGNVGIGTTSPSEKLHVNGQLRLEIDTDTVGENGTIRWTGSDLELKKEGLWISLDSSIRTSGIHDFSVISGGFSNSVNDVYSVVSGGQSNIASKHAVVSGGQSNVATGDWSVIAGGVNNQANASQSFVGGGTINIANGDNSTISGGGDNVTNGDYDTISGGESHITSGHYSTISGGYTNVATSIYSTVGGGIFNQANNASSTVGGGRNNHIFGDYGTISGGRSNESSGDYATVGGGNANTASGDYSTIVGGANMTISGNNSFGFNGMGTAQTSSAANAAIFMVNNFGIGTLAPTEKLHVDGQVRLATDTDTVGENGTIRWNGTDLQVKKSGVWTSLTGASAAGPFDDYAFIADRKAANVGGGTSPASAIWNVRDLQTEVSDTGSLVTISVNQFTLAAGSYYIKADAPAKAEGQHMIRLKNVTDSTVEATGTSEFSYSLDVQTRSFLTAQITIVASKTFQIEHWLQEISKVHGFGQPTNQGEQETYTRVEIWKK